MTSFIGKNLARIISPEPVSYTVSQCKNKLERSKFYLDEIIIARMAKLTTS